jgi:iron complex outermembrane receptor protein
MKIRTAVRPCAVLFSTFVVLQSTAALAQQASPTAADTPSRSATRLADAGNAAPAPSDAGVVDEVLVTARKRQESILNVPVVEQAISQTKLERLQVTEMTDLPTIVPGLNLGHSLLSIGTLVSIRGIGTASQDPGVDQSVSLNIDGLSLGNGLAFDSGLFDLGQIEVLKGPQALFYGKSSPGGVISLRTADPTNELEVIGRAAYEFESVNPRGELILSGPVTDTLKLRLAGMYSSADGYFDNVATGLPGTGGLTPQFKHDPDSKDYIIRGTALWDPSSALSARLKYNLVHDRAINADTLQCTSSPSGTAPINLPGFGTLPPFLGGGEDCKLDRVQRTVDLDPAAFIGALNNGVPFLESTQTYGTLELNYHAVPDVTLTSTTGVYHLTSESLANASQSTFAGPFIGVNNHFGRREVTEELRANSDYSGPVNFTAGALYEDGHLNDHVAVLSNQAFAANPTYGGNPATPGYLAVAAAPTAVDGTTPVDIRTYSVFGQVRWDFIEKMELAAGLRWTDEKRDETPFNYLLQEATVVPTPDIHTKNVSPEITLTYKPTDEMALFAAAKRGYKSGSFSIATPPVTGVDNSFGDERVTGGEAGLKSRLLERQLTLEVAGYFYNYTGLQVGVISPPRNGIPIIQTVNAATARTYGIDLDGSYRPSAVEGLGISGSLNYNHARYLKFNNAPCWGGQLISEGCNQNFNPTTGLYTAQNLSGTPLIRAPLLQGTVGFDYQLALAGDYKLVFGNSNEVSSRYTTYLATDRPNNDNFQAAFVKVDLSLSLQSPDNRWEVAVIGKDLNDRVTAGNCVSSPLRGGAILATPVGSNVRPSSGIDPTSCFADPGREVWLRLTVRPFAAKE